MIQLCTEQDFLRSDGTRGMSGIMVDNENGLISPMIPKSAYSWTRHNLYNITDPEQNYLNYSANELSKLKTFQINFGMNSTPAEIQRYMKMINVPKYVHYKCLIPVREPLNRYTSAMAEVLYRVFRHQGNASDSDIKTIKLYLHQFIKQNDILNNPAEFLYSASDVPLHDVHLRTQTALMGGLPKNHEHITWFKVDTYTNDLKRWLKANNIPKKINTEHSNSSTKNSFKSFVQGYISALLNYDQQYKQKVMQYYREDIELYDSLCV